MLLQLLHGRVGWLIIHLQDLYKVCDGQHAHELLLLRVPERGRTHTIVDQRIEGLLHQQLGVEDDQFSGGGYQIIALVKTKELDKDLWIVLLCKEERKTWVKMDLVGARSNLFGILDYAWHLAWAAERADASSPRRSVRTPWCSPMDSRAPHWVDRCRRAPSGPHDSNRNAAVTCEELGFGGYRVAWAEPRRGTISTMEALPIDWSTHARTQWIDFV